MIYVFTHDSIGSAKTARPISRSSSWPPCAPFRDWLLFAQVTPTRPPLRGGSPSSRAPAGGLGIDADRTSHFGSEGICAGRGLRRGAYVLADAPNGKPDLVLIGTGSEVGLVVAARQKLAEQKIQARVVSMPSWELFDLQPSEYRESVLPSVDSAAAGSGGGTAARVAPLCRRQRRRYWNRAIWRLGAGQCGDGKARLHRGSCRGTCLKLLGK